MGSFIIFYCIFIAIVESSIDFKIVKLEACSSSKKSVTIQNCEGNEGQFSLSFDIFRSLPKIHIQLNLFKIENAEFKPIFKSRPIEWCVVAQGKTKANPIVKTFLSNQIGKLPEALRTCPVIGSFVFQNITVSTRMFAILPPASYRLQGKAYDTVDKEIFYFSVLFRIDQDKRN
ncbi:hypothetical protein PVAND_016501 [Polypedilum vanderplanki]|uniref:MD-2-related lipid-recognition domain-containing protein n=1 Tax=Polypedilum vanderplanki TaxID=319348 RepID=A0A9J6BFA9_POLVA|nr:hypothetical protein PVAND_016501 [Polypedilum vanderplanki]